MANQDMFFSKLAGTLKDFFRIGNSSTGVRLKAASGVLQSRNAGDTAFADIAANQIKVQGANASNAVVLAAPAGLSGNVTLTLPNGVGATGQVLTTNGADTLSWSTVAASSDKTEVEAFTQATSSPLTIFTPAANAVVREVMIEISVAAGAGSPTLKVGKASDDDAYMETTENDPKTVGQYIVTPNVDVGATPEALILTLTPAGQSFTGKVYVVHSLPA